MGSVSKIEHELGFSEKTVANNEKHGHTYMQWLYALLASMTLLTYGLQAGWISPMTKILQSEESPTGTPLTDSELSWIGSILALTATLGVVLYVYIADTYGRKFGVIAVAVPQALCWIIKLFATNTTMLLVARIFGGIPAGGCFNLIPMYVKEISQDNIRGAVVSMVLMMQNFGILAIYSIGSYLGYYTVLYIVIPLPVLTAVLMVFAPESPAFLVKKAKFEEAAKTTALLRGLKEDDKVVQTELQYMRNEEMHYNSLPRITFFNIFQNKAWRQGFMLAMLLITAQAFNGIFVIITYAYSIISASGVDLSPELLSLLVPVVMIFGSLFSIACVEKTGRKILLSGTFALSAMAFLVLASTQLIQALGGNPVGWLSVVALGIGVWANAAGLMPITYVVMSEMFSFQVRAKLIGCIVTYAWFISSCQLSIYTPISAALGSHTMFFVFAGVNLFGAAVALVIPETRGKTVQEIEKILAGNK